MPQPIIIVDPVSSGSELAPQLAARNIPSIAVCTASLSHSNGIGYAAKIKSNHFLEIYHEHPNLLDNLKRLNPRAVIAGSESGVQLADQLAAAITPHMANLPELSEARRHKGKMQKALENVGLPVIRTLNTTSIDEVAEWITTHNLTHSPVVIKPPASAGSDNVLHIPKGGNWKKAFQNVLSSPNSLMGGLNESVIVQEQAIGTEYAVDTVSAAGKHVLSHLMRYKKSSAGDRMTVFDHSEFIQYDPVQHADLLDYTRKALDALGIQWGAAHSEIMLTQDGPRLIETGARMCGGPVLNFARVATGCSQLERVLEAYLDGEIRTQSYDFKKTVLPIFLIAPTDGVLRNVEILDQVRSLSTHLVTHLWSGNGDFVRRTVDFDTNLGIIALAGERSAVFSDYARVREIEAQLVLNEVEH